MASENHRSSADEAQQMNQPKHKSAASGKRAVRCVKCRKEFNDCRMLQQHRRKSCPNSTLRFLCRKCKAFFASKLELNSHISTVHAGHLRKKVRESKNTGSIHSCQNEFKISSAFRSEEMVVDQTEQSVRESRLRQKKVHKRLKKSVDPQKLKSAKVAKQVRKFKKTATDVKCTNREKAAVETWAVGSNPFSFTTSCAPDARLFQFLCQSCLTVRFATYMELRQHEEWCARVRNGHGFLCLPCGRHYRSQGTLRRHAGQYHMSSLLSEAKTNVGNPFHFSTAIALDAVNYPHVCLSCMVASFGSPAELRKHEDWCGQCASVKDGFKCDKCGRCFRTTALLERHTTAGDCTKTTNTAGAVDDGNFDRGTESENSVSSINQESAPEKIHGVCPLCDVPFISQYEQQAHFTNIHNLTASERKVKQSRQGQSRRGLFGTQVSCLDCDRTFPSRLELVQHKRICTKEKKFTAAVLPVTLPSSVPSANDLSSSKSCHTVEDGISLKEKNGQKVDQETTHSSVSDKNAAEHGNQSEDAATELSSGTSGTQKLEIPRRMLLNTTKVRNLLRRSSAKQLLLKSNGKLLLLGDDGQKISTVSVVEGQELETGKLVSNRDLKSTAESREYVSVEENSCQTGDILQTSSPDVNRTVGNQCQIRQHPGKSSTAKSGSVSELKTKTLCEVDNQRKPTRKRTRSDDVVDVVESGTGNRVGAAKVKNGVVRKEESVQWNSKSKKSADFKQNSVVKAIDWPVTDSDSEVKVTAMESLSEMADGHQTVLEALELVPITAELNHTDTVTARYRTRSSTHACFTTPEGDVSKKSRCSSDGKNLSGSSASSGHKGLRSSTETARNRNKTTQVVNHESTDVGGETAPQRTWTVERVGNSLVRCVACKVIFQTVSQIVDHKCDG